MNSISVDFWQGRFLARKYFSLLTGIYLQILQKSLFLNVFKCKCLSLPTHSVNDVRDLMYFISHLKDEAKCKFEEH